MTEKQQDETGDAEFRVSDSDLPPFFFEQDRPSGRTRLADVRCLFARGRPATRQTMMDHQELMRQLDQDVAEFKVAAQVQIAKEIQEDLRRKLPIFLRRFERGTSTKNPIKAGIMAAMVETLREDQKLAAGFFLTAIANQHLRRRMMEDVANEVEAELALYHLVRISRVVDSVLQGCALLIECYPAIAKPASEMRRRQTGPPLLQARQV